MKVEGRWRRSIELVDDTVVVLDQARLPYEVHWLRLAELADFERAIREMHIRGAPLIGATAAYGIAVALRQGIALDTAAEALARTRPTAVNLRWAIDTMRRELAEAPSSERAFAIAERIATEDIARCEAIGEHGLALIRKAAERGGPVRVLTHCNAGWLATVDWGTALAPIYKAYEAGIPIHVWVDETRPRNQGVLTAWELAQHGVPHTLIADNAGGHLMQRGDVDLCIVGTDRTTRRGDVCNKIGTYLKALAAHDCNVPFYAAVPTPSIDWSCDNADTIPIEERSADEVRYIRGVQITDADVRNPAFDVTPKRLVTALITEHGVVEPDALADLERRS